MWFSLGRTEGFPTVYEPRTTCASVDTLEVGFITAFFISLAPFLIVFVLSRTWKTVSKIL